MIPFISELHLITIANISTAITKRHADNWHPCLTPLVKFNPSDRCPLFMILLLMLVCKIPIHLVICSGKLKNVKAFCINDHSIVSKAL